MYYLIILFISLIIVRMQIIYSPRLKGYGSPVVWLLRYAGSWKRLVASAIARINRFPREYIKQKTVRDQRVTVHLVCKTSLWSSKLAKRNAWRFYDPWCLLWYYLTSMAILYMHIYSNAYKRQNHFFPASVPASYAIDAWESLRNIIFVIPKLR